MSVHAEHDATLHPEDPARSPRILIVDDTPANLRLLADTLRGHGFDTRAALSGPAALQAAHAETPDLVLLDIGMPGMDGFEVCEVMKADPQLADVPIIFISALDETMDKVRAFAVGGVDYVTKPFQFEEVLARVQTHLRLAAALEAQREAAELRARFIAMASHEFRTPLTTILSSAEMLECYGDNWPAEKRVAHLKRIEASATSMAALLEDVLLLGRASAGRLTFEPAEVELAELCRNAVDEVTVATGAGSRIVVDLGGPLVTMADERLMRQLLENLLSNALKYSADDAPVSLRLDATPERGVRVAVSDCGIGIPVDDISHLGEPFYRASNVGAAPGTGLGLSLVREVVDLHGGTLKFDSEPGVGTTVTVLLPPSGDAQRGASV